MKAVGHNIADSLGSGIGLLVGIYELDVYAEACASPQGFIEIDFLTGHVSGGPVSHALAEAVKRYRDALPAFCERHGVAANDFRQLSAHFSGQGVLRGFTVTVENDRGQMSVDAFRGVPGKRLKGLDQLGRVRPVV